MNTSTYYNLKLVEGTDIVNPLTTDVPNYETIDEQMHNNAIGGVTLATEVANGTTHALIRENSECAVIRFIATSNWTLGDTITVDGIPVVALLPSGEVLPSGAYVINANVLCILTGTNLTIYAERKKVDNANELAYNDTTVGEKLTEIDDELGYIDITDQFTVNSDKVRLFAYAENGMVTIDIQLRAGFNGSINIANLNNLKYAPRITAYGFYNCTGSGADKNAYLGSYIDRVGTMYVWCDTEIVGIENVTFLYSIQRN